MDVSALLADEQRKLTRSPLCTFSRDAIIWPLTGRLTSPQTANREVKRADVTWSQTAGRPVQQEQGKANGGVDLDAP